MDSYTTLIKNVLQCRELTTEIEKCLSEDDILNLIVPNWEEHLNNNVIYQEFKNDAKNMYAAEKNPDSIFRLQYFKNGQVLKILLLANCSTYVQYEPEKNEKNKTNRVFCIIIKDTPVLNMLMEGFNNDLDLENVQFSDTFKVNFQGCGIFCKNCSFAISHMQSEGLDLKFDCIQPCIADTMVYNGTKVINQFASQITNSSPGGYKAIMQLNINCRYFYKIKDQPKTIVRLGGSATKMIAFPETNLKEATIYLGNLSALNQTMKSFVKEEMNNDSVGHKNGKQKQSIDDEETVIDILLPNQTHQIEGIDMYSSLSQHEKVNTNTRNEFEVDPEQKKRSLDSDEETVVNISPPNKIFKTEDEEDTFSVFESVIQFN